MEINSSEVVEEVALAFADYEQALVDNDVERIMGFFAPDAVRFGVADHQAGLDEQQRWRRAQTPLPPGRRLKDTTILSYGHSVAVVTTFFGYPGSNVLGRQSQTWVRLPEGWRIVSAHVSLPSPPQDGPYSAHPTLPAPDHPVDR